jgi:hypothetical protein
MGRPWKTNGPAEAVPPPARYGFYDITEP